MKHPRLHAILFSGILGLFMAGACVPPENVPAETDPLAPLASWQPEEAKLLGLDPVQYADLPAEWRGLEGEDLFPLYEEVTQAASGECTAGRNRESLLGHSAGRYLALLLEEPLTAVESLKIVCDRLIKLHRYCQALEYLDTYDHELEALRAQMEGFVYVSFASSYLRGNCHLGLGDYAQAERHFRSYLEIARKGGHRDARIAALNRIGHVLRYYGEFDEALASYRQALALSREGDAKGTIADSQNNIGLVHMDQGRPEEALACFREYLEIELELGDKWAIPMAYNNTGELVAGLGLWEEARAYFEEALAIKRELDDPVLLASGLLNLGRVLCAMDETDEGLIHLQESLEVSLSLPGPHPRINALASLGEFSADRGEWENALGRYREALAVAQQFHLPLEEGTCLGEIGHVLTQSEQYESALENLTKALELQRSVGDELGEARTLEIIGDAWRGRADLERAAESYAAAFAVRRRFIRQFTWESGLKAKLAGDLHGVGGKLAQTYFALGMLDEAFAITQACKGIPLLQLLSQAKQPVGDAAVLEALETFRNANATIEMQRDALRALPSEEDLRRLCIQTAEDEGGGQAGKPGLDEELFHSLVEQTATQRENHRKEIELHAAEASAAWQVVEQRAPEVAEIADIQGVAPEAVQHTLLRDGQALLEYVVTDDAVIVLAQGNAGPLVAGCSSLPGSGSESFASWIDRKVKGLFDPRPAIRGEAARELYDLLIGPAAAAVADAEHLVICPDGPLFAVPFDALVDEAGVLLLRQHTVTYASSATMLTYVREAEPSEGALVAGVSFLPVATNSGVSPGGSDGGGPPAASGDDLFPRHLLAPLPGIYEETQAVADALGAAPALDEVVTEEWLRSAMPGKRVIHLATHGRLSSSPLLNGLYTHLPPASQAVTLEGEGISANDGFLTMGEVMGIPLDGCELVVLSCCHSFESDAGAGQGLMGISQGFIYAGARAVIATQTRVDDGATRLLMETFYSEWCDQGLSKAEALREAKLSLAQDDRYSSPRYWAPFVLYGTE